MRPNRLCCVVSAAAIALCVAVSSAETTEAKEVSSHSTAADFATLCVEFGEHALVSVLNYDDELPSLPAPEPPKRILDDHLCTLVPRETPVPSYGCVRDRSGCRGLCYSGVYDAPASICLPSPGNRCVGSRAPVRVLFTHVGVCKSDCSCQVLERLQRPIETTIDEWRCNI